MGDLDFKTFARALEPLLSEGKTLGVFASTLFEEITSYRDEDENPIHSTTQDTFRGYMNGRGISWLASKIAGHIDKEKFEIYIEGYGADTQDAIYRALSDYISGMTSVNIPESCASAFEEIILEAAAVKRGQVSKVLASSLTDDEYLIEESRGRCLNCGASLVASGDGSPVSNREKVRITPPAFDYKIIGKYRKSGILPEPNTLADLAMLCPACARDYRENPTREKFEALVKAKMRVHELFTTGLDVDICDLENHVREVVESLSSLSEADTSQDLQFDAHAVDEKIKGDFILAYQIKMNAVGYYRFIEEMLRDMDGSGELSFEMVALQFRACYLKASKGCKDQATIFETIVDWVSRKTGIDNRIACGIVVSFFVQNCEVFDAAS